MTTLNVLIALLGGLTGLLGAILSIVALRRRIIAGLSNVIRDVLLETGLTKYGKPAAVWPNGSTNLPDFLEVIWNTQKRLNETTQDKPPPDIDGAVV